MKTPGKYFIVKLVVYPFDVMVSINEPDAVLLKRLQKYGNTRSDCEGLLNLPVTVTGRTVMLPSNQTVIRFKKAPKFKMIKPIAHETFHAVTFIMERVGVQFNFNTSDEAYAYLIGYLAAEIYNNI